MSVYTGKAAQGAESLQNGDNTQVMRILVVEDEERLARLMSRVLVEEGYAVETEANGRQALMRALADEYDLLIVDWMLPELSGVQLVKRLRAAGVGTPAIMLTARDQNADRVEGLDAGADDYLPKPFAFPELLARVRALARRPWGEEIGDAILGAGDVTLDPVRHVVRHGGEIVDLTAKEFALLATLLQRPGQVFTRPVLLDTVWGASPEVYANVVDLYVSYLRKKLDGDSDTSHIRTVRGVGYTFEAQPGPR